MPRDGFENAIEMWLSAAELAAARLPGVPLTRQGVMQLAQRNGWLAPEREGAAWRQRQGRGGGVEINYRCLPVAAQARLLQHVPTPQPAARATEGVAAERWAWFDRQPEKLKDKARRRMAALMRLRQLIDAGSGRLRAIEMVKAEQGIKKSQIYELEKLVDGLAPSDWLPFLAPMHGGGRPEAECTPEALNWLFSLYLKPSRPVFEECCRLLREKAAAEGWTVPSNRTLLRQVRALPKPLVIKEREGEEALKRSLPPLKRDRAVFGALEALNGDGHIWDVFVTWPDGTVSRPNMVAFQDVFSGKFLSWRVDQTLSWHLVRLAFGDVVENYGIPDHCWLDNGREFAAKKITGGQKNRFRFKIRDDEPMGLMTQLGVEVHWTQPYWGQSKPIERAFGDFSRNIARHPAFNGAYTGSKVTAKPDNYGTKAVPLETFLRVIGSRIAEHNARLGRRSPTCNGQSFDQVFEASYATRSIRRATEAQRRLWLLAAEGVTIRATDGRIVFMGNEYWSDWLLQHAGQKAIIRFDPAFLDQPLHVYALDGRYLGEAEPWVMAGFNSVEAAQKKARLTREAIRLARRQREVMDLRDAEELAEGQPDFAPAAPPETKLIRPFFPVQGNAALAAQPSAREREDDQERLLAALRAQPRPQFRVVEEDEE